MQLGGAKSRSPFYRALAVTFSRYHTPIFSSDLNRFKTTRQYLKWKALLNPLNWIEFVFALLYHTVARITEIGAKPVSQKKYTLKTLNDTQLSSRPVNYIYYSTVRTAVRVIICFPFYLAYTLVRFVTSPVKTIINRLLKMIDKYPVLFFSGMIIGTLFGAGLVLFANMYPGVLTLPFVFPYILAGINALTQLMGIQMLAVATMTLAGAALGFALMLVIMVGTSRILDAVERNNKNKDDYKKTGSLLAAEETENEKQEINEDYYLKEKQDTEPLPKFFNNPANITNHAVNGHPNFENGSATPTPAGDL